MGQERQPQDGGELSTRRRIDAACDRFEVAWRAGASPRIEEYLDGWPHPDRNELLFELLGVELELRLEAGEDPSLADYRTRFPELATVTDAVLSGCSDVRSGAGVSSDRIPFRAFPTRSDGTLEPPDRDWLATRDDPRPSRDFGERTTKASRDAGPRPSGETTELMARTPELPVLTATDLRNALASMTERMPGAPDPADDPDQTLSSDALRLSAITDEAIPDPARRDLEATVGLGDRRLLPARRRSASAPTAGMTIPGYDLLEKLGEGGMGVVYKALQVDLNRLVAVKMIRGDGANRPDQVARIRIEAESIARLRHPHILQIHHTGVVGDCPFLALELLDGGSLADRLAHTPQPGRSSAELMATLARAIHAAHQVGIIHRDLKPSNVLFTPDGIPKISDFGLAKRLESDSTETQSGLIMGSPSYMAPEQARGNTKNVGPSADIYSLGAIFYEMLTGRPPFKGETAMETVRQVADDDPVPPSRLVPRLTRDLETICLKCLSKEPHQRYDSASDLADDLERHLRGESIKARSAGLWERGVKWARRRPALATLAAFILLATATGSWLAWREGRRIEGLRTEVVRSILTGQARLAEGKWGDASEHLVKAHTQTGDEPQLDELRRQAAALLDRVELGRAEHEARDAEQAIRDADQRRYREFLRLRDEALIQDTRFTGLDGLGNPEQTRRATLAALAVFAARDSGDSWKPENLPSSLLPSQRDEIRSGTYALLMILAEVAERPDEGLRLLDQAARLHPPTRAYHLRRGACLARKGDAEGAERELPGRRAHPDDDRVRSFPRRTGAVPAPRLDRGQAAIQRRAPAPAGRFLGQLPRGDLRLAAPPAVDGQGRADRLLADQAGPPLALHAPRPRLAAGRRAGPVGRGRSRF